MKHLALSLAVLLVLFAGCGDEETSPMTPGPQQARILFTFDEDIDGWDTGTSSIDWGKVAWKDFGESLELDGVGNSDPEPNAWARKTIDMPASTKSLRYDSSAHNRGGGTGFLRVRIAKPGGAWETLLDWEKREAGNDEFLWETTTLDISSYGGGPATISFELDDIDGGGSNQRYVDNVEILY